MVGNDWFIFIFPVLACTSAKAVIQSGFVILAGVESYWKTKGHH
jgi:hypothetical protein